MARVNLNEWSDKQLTNGIPMLENAMRFQDLAGKKRTRQDIKDIKTEMESRGLEGEKPLPLPKGVRGLF